MENLKWCLGFLTAYIKDNKKKSFALKPLIEKHIKASKELEQLTKKQGVKGCVVCDDTAVMDVPVCLSCRNDLPA